MLMYSRQKTACFEHSNFFKVNDLELQPEQVPPKRNPNRPSIATQLSAATSIQKVGTGWPVQTLWADRASQKKPRNPTTSFLTATALIYATGAGITAAAGTRLALQLLLIKGFKLNSFQLQDPFGTCIVICCHYLLVSRVGNLRACCLP